MVAGVEGREVSGGATSVPGRVGEAVVGAGALVGAVDPAAAVPEGELAAVDVRSGAAGLPHAATGSTRAATTRPVAALRPHRMSRSSRIRRDTRGMPYDTETADRVRECLATTPAVSERRMFGGLSFLVGGRMAVAVSGSGGLLLRCAPDRSEEFAAREHVGRWEMRGKEMAGWLRIDPSAYESDDDLATWVAMGVEQAQLVK